MVKKFRVFGGFLFVMLLLQVVLGAVANGSALSDGGVTLSLVTNRSVYAVGENVSLALKIVNRNNVSVPGQISGKVIIGDVGYEIQCFDYTAPANKTTYLELTPLPASMSNSNRKVMTTLYACSGTRMQSSKIFYDNRPINQTASRESFEIGPFMYSFTVNGTSYVVKSNVLNVTVVAPSYSRSGSGGSIGLGNSKSGSGGSSSQTSSHNEGTGGSRTSSGVGNKLSGSTKESNSLGTSGQRYLVNSQRNGQTVSQLKKEIEKEKQGVLGEGSGSEGGWFWLWLIVLVLAVLGLVWYSQFLKKSSNDSSKIREGMSSNEKLVKEIVVPDYMRLLERVREARDEKEKARLLSRAVRAYIAEKRNVSKELTHSEAMRLTNNKLFVRILKDTELIEFANRKVKLDYEGLVKQLREIFEGDKNDKE